MGQITLGIRSLLIKGAVFFLLAALLAWVLGGTLFPRAERADYPAVQFAGAEWNVRLSVGGDRPGIARYQLMRRQARSAEPVGAEFAESSRIVVTDRELLVGMRRWDDEGGQWVLRRIAADGTEVASTVETRLELELLLAAPTPSPDA